MYKCKTSIIITLVMLYAFGRKQIYTFFFNFVHTPLNVQKLRMHFDLFYGHLLKFFMLLRNCKDIKNALYLLNILHFIAVN